MGFLSKFLKKAKPLLPFAAMMGMGPLMGMFGSAGSMGGIGSLLGGMNPIAANFLKQGAMSYGLGKLTGQEHPEKGALWAGLASVPFSMYGGAQAAGAFNKAKGLSPEDTGYQNMWDVLSSNKYKKIPYGDPMEIVGRSKPQFEYGMTGTDKYLSKPSENLFKHISQRTAEAPRAASLFSKPEMLNPVTGKAAWFGGVPTGETAFNMMPTLASQAAGLYGGRATEEEEWAATKERRKKELAWMYGVDPDQIEGEMDNPWHTGGYFNTGGIASLDMDNGGGVSGPGTGTSDSIDAKLSDGEFVMTAKAVESLGGGDRYEGARQLYSMMNLLDPESETMSEVT